MALSFDELPVDVQMLEPTVSAGITGSILGVIGDGPVANARYDAVSKASLVVCFNYAARTPTEVLIEAAIRLAGWILGTRAHASGSRTEDPSSTVLQLEFTNKQATANGLRASGASALLSRFVVRRALAVGGPVAAAVEPVRQDDGTMIMRFGFASALPFVDHNFRWLGTVNGTVLDSTWTQPAAFGFWIPGNVMDRVIAFAAIEYGTGVTVSLDDFGPAAPYRFGDTLGMLRHTPLTFVGTFVQPNTFRAVLEAR